MSTRKAVCMLLGLVLLGSTAGLAVAADDLVAPPLTLAAAAEPAVAEPVADTSAGTAANNATATSKPAGNTSFAADIYASPPPVKEKAAAKGAGPVFGGPVAGPPTSMPSDPLQAFIWKTKNPIPGFLRWGADYRGRDEYMRNVAGLNKNIKEDSTNWWRHRGRVWSTISLGDWLDFNSRIAWEGRNWTTPGPTTLGPGVQPWDSGDVLFDVLNFSLKKPAGLPFTLTVGRQEIALGDMWLVFDGTPYDGSRTLYFDAVRLTLDLQDIKTKIDAIYIDQDAESQHWVGMIYPNPHNQRTGLDTQRYVTEQSEQGAIVWVENKSLKDTELDGYFIYKHDLSDPFPFSDNADIYTFGTRAVHDFNEHWKLRDEVAGQFGNKNGNRLCAFATLNRLAYYFNDKYKNWLRLDYEYMSGDKPGTGGTDEGFDPLWGRWPRFSELWIYVSPTERRPADLGNFHRASLGWSTTPIPQLTILTDYHLLFADQNTYRASPAFSEGGKFRGQLLTCWLKYQITPQLSGDLIAEVLWPGDYYDKVNNDPAMFLRGQVVFTY